MDQPSRDPALDGLDALVGEWTMEAKPPGGPPWPGEGRVTFEWLEGRTFLIERWRIDLPEAPDGIAIIGLRDAPASAEAVSDQPGDAGKAYRQHYFDSRGVHRIYEMTLSDGVWKLWRDSPDPFPQRFTGTFSDDGKTISGRWEKADDGNTWVTDFDLTYTKANSGA
jgi:hypothetical protein